VNLAGASSGEQQHGPADADERDDVADEDPKAMSATTLRTRTLTTTPITMAKASASAACSAVLLTRGHSDARLSRRSCY
jgi:hypothetical protein